MMWLKEGDANTKYFHSVLKGHKNKNSIKFVRCQDGSVSSDLKIIKREFVSHFKSILAQTKECVPINPEVINRGNNVEENQCRGLIKEASDKEIWEALSKIEADKAPGPDGFSANFYKTNWNLIGKEFYKSIRHCFKYKSLPKGTNSAFIALIPKTSLAAEPGDFRSISCCNVLRLVQSDLGYSG
ncbi:hypothetical protein QQ045_002932 [Rhodiola kirilowii]